MPELGGGRNGELPCSRRSALVLQSEKAQEITCTTTWISLSLVNCILKIGNFVGFFMRVQNQAVYLMCNQGRPLGSPKSLVTPLAFTLSVHGSWGTHLFVHVHSDKQGQILLLVRTGEPCKVSEGYSPGVSERDGQPPCPGDA